MTRRRTGASSSQNQHDDNIPQEYKDMTFSHAIMVDPVETTAGNIYEKYYIKRWFEQNDIDPHPGAKPLTSKKLKPKKKLLETIRKKYPKEWRAQKSIIDQIYAEDATREREPRRQEGLINFLRAPVLLLASVGIVLVPLMFYALIQGIAGARTRREAALSRLQNNFHLDPKMETTNPTLELADCKNEILTQTRTAIDLKPSLSTTIERVMNQAPDLKITCTTSNLSKNNQINYDKYGRYTSEQKTLFFKPYNTPERGQTKPTPLLSPTRFFNYMMHDAYRTLPATVSFAFNTANYDLTFLCSSLSKDEEQWLLRKINKFDQHLEMNRGLMHMGADNQALTASQQQEIIQLQDFDRPGLLTAAYETTFPLSPLAFKNFKKIWDESSTDFATLRHPMFGPGFWFITDMNEQAQTIRVRPASVLAQLFHIPTIITALKRDHVINKFNLSPYDSRIEELMEAVTKQNLPAEIALRMSYFNDEDTATLFRIFPELKEITDFIEQKQSNCDEKHLAKDNTPSP